MILKLSCAFDGFPAVVAGVSSFVLRKCLPGSRLLLCANRNGFFFLYIYIFLYQILEEENDVHCQYCAASSCDGQSSFPDLLHPQQSCRSVLQVVAGSLIYLFIHWFDWIYFFVYLLIYFGGMDIINGRAVVSASTSAFTSIKLLSATADPSIRQIKSWNFVNKLSGVAYINSQEEKISP